MNKTVLKIFSAFVFSSVLIVMLILCINFIGFSLLISDIPLNTNEPRPSQILAETAEMITTSDSGGYRDGKDIIPDGWWCILIDEDGSIIWSCNKPDDIPNHYTINSVASMSRWFLNDYPVYVRTEDIGLIVLGKPKNSVAKYNMEYSMGWFSTLAVRIFIFLGINLCLALLFALIFGTRLYKNLKRITTGINDMRREKPVKLRERGIFKEISKNINETSKTIERKNAALAARDNARSNWIAGISHDIRTPLSVITGCSESLSCGAGLSEEQQKKASAILSNSIKIKKLIDDLNVISSLEYDMQPTRKTTVKICPLLRSVVTDIINNGLSENFTVDLDLKYEKAAVTGDAQLLERAVFNLINNAVTHNKDGCNIKITEEKDGGSVKITIADDGAGVSEEIIKNIETIPKTSHGLGLPMAYRIAAVHGGTLTAKNDNGFTAQIILPLA